MSIKLSIADDHKLIIDTFEKILVTTGYIEICGKYTSGEDLIEGFKKIVPEILLLDYHFPEQNGAQLARYVGYHYPEVKIIMLTGFDKPGLATEMLEYGCMGYLLKSTADTDMIIEAIDLVYNGHIYLDKSLRGKFAHVPRKKQNTDVRQKLSSRELEVLKEISKGLSNPEIAEKLHISRRTVDNHRNSIMIKSGAKNTANLIRLAMELKLI
jgi:DNA-binding NarL/FixJ family response regulator